MDSPLRSDQIEQIRQQCFSKFEALTGFYPKTLKQRILALLTYDYDWWSMFNMVLVLNGATSIDQRINEMIREEKIEFDQRHEGPNVFFWKLLTDPSQIDFKRCTLKPPEPVASLRYQCSKLPAPTPLQMEISL